MDKCIYKGRIIIAKDYAKLIETEKELRNNSKLLICCDPECHSEIIFRHGTIRTPHFAHKSINVKCHYDEYCSDMSNTIKEIRNKLYDQLKAIENTTGYKADYDVLLFERNHHYTNLTLTGNKKFAVDIINTNKASTKKAKKQDEINNLYKETDYTPLPIIIDSNITHNFNLTNNVYYNAKCALNELHSYSSIIYNENLKQFYICKIDDESYIVEEKDIRQCNNLDNVFTKKVDLSQITISDTGFNTKEFENEYEVWKEKRHQKFKKDRLDFIRINKSIDLSKRQSNIDQKRTRSIDEIKKSKEGYNESIWMIIQMIAKDLNETEYKNHMITSKELKDFFSSENPENKKSYLYRVYNNSNLNVTCEKIKKRMISQINSMRKETN